MVNSRERKILLAGELLNYDALSIRESQLSDLSFELYKIYPKYGFF